MALAPVRLQEAADSLAKASTPEPFSKSRTSNWVARVGGLPDYIQHIAHDLVEKRGKSESNAIQMAIGIVKRWARGGGKVDSGTRAAAAKAVSEWESKKAANAAKSAVQHSALEPLAPSLADELAVRDAALERLLVLEGVLGGQDGMIGLLAEGAQLQEADSKVFQPTLKRTASAPGEVERHEVYDGDQHVGTLGRRRGLGGEGDRYAMYVPNGERVTDYSEKSRQAAIDALHRHLEEAPARVVALPTAGKFLVAKPQTYSGQTTYTQFSTEQAARHAAGLPASPTTPEIRSNVVALGESLRWDLLTVAGLDIPPLRRVQEARRRDPFDLAEDFHPDELRGFHGRWVRGQGQSNPLGRSAMRSRLTPLSVVPMKGRPGKARDHSPAAQRYDGGVVRKSAKARTALAAKPQIPPKMLGKAVGAGKWSSSAARATKDIVAGRVLSTEHAHRVKNPDGSLGAFSEERQQLHDRILTLMLQGKATHSRPEVHFTAGGPASGKSGLVRTGDAAFERQIGKDSMVNLPRDIVHADPDTIRAMLPEYQAMVAAGRKDASNKTHEEASYLAKALTKVALGRQHHLLVDTTGDSGPGKFAGKIAQAKAAGYGVHVHYATTDIATALARAEERGKSSGRFVPEKYLRDTHASVSHVFASEISKIPGVHLRVIDTTARPNKVIAERSPGGDKLVIKDRELYGRFLKKANG